MHHSINPYLVPPIKILTYQFKQLIVKPCEDLGEALGKLGGSMFSNYIFFQVYIFKTILIKILAHLPWGLNIVIFPIMLIAVLVVLFYCFVFLTRTRIRFSSWFFSLEFGGEASTQERRPISNRAQSVSQINYVKHRKFIQDVSTDSSNKSGSDELKTKPVHRSKSNQELKKPAEKKKNESPDRTVEKCEKKNKTL